MMARPNGEERRKEPRLLCADLVTVYWLDELGTPRKAVANLEDVSHCGACLLMDMGIAPESEVRIDTGKGHYLGQVRYMASFEIGFVMGIQFLPGCEWEASRFQPAHLFDPRSLLREEEEPQPIPARAAAPEPAPSPAAAARITQDDLQRLLRLLRSDLA